MKTLYPLLALFCMLQSGISFAQQKQHAVIALASARYDSIVIRWAPAGQVAWLSGNRHGYLIERFVIARDGKPVELAGQQSQN
jgi:hypothetical protein